MDVVVPKGWQLAPFSAVACLERATISPTAITSGTLYVGLEHINGEGRFDLNGGIADGEIASTKFRFTEEHLLYGKLRPYLKKIARPTFAGVCSTDILPIRPLPALDRSYLLYYLRQPQLIELATTRSSGANLPRLSPKQLEAFPVAFPPLPEQRRIAAILDQADAIRRKRAEGVRLTDELLGATFLDLFGDPATNPKGWPIRVMREIVAETQYGTAAKANSDGGGIPVLRMNNITYAGEIDASDLKWCDIPEADRLRYTVQRGDLLFRNPNAMLKPSGGVRRPGA